MASAVFAAMPILQFTRRPTWARTVLSQRLVASPNNTPPALPVIEHLSQLKRAVGIVALALVRLRDWVGGRWMSSMGHREAPSAVAARREAAERLVQAVGCDLSLGFLGPPEPETRSIVLVTRPLQLVVKNGIQVEPTNITRGERGG